MQKDQQRPTKDSKTHHKQQQNSYAIDVLASTAATLEYEICNNKDQENGSDPIEQQLKRKHIELLERNRYYLQLSQLLKLLLRIFDAGLFVG